MVFRAAAFFLVKKQVGKFRRTSRLGNYKKFFR